MVQMLKPRLAATSTQRGTMLALNPGATPRMRGKGWMTRRAGWLRAHPLCCMCEADGLAMLATELDHINPLALGGADDASNWQSLCAEHHKAKSARERRMTNGPG